MNRRSAGLLVSGLTPAAVTDADGRFSIPHLPARPVLVDIPGVESRGLWGEVVTPAAEEVEVRLRVAVKLAGRR